MTHRKASAKTHHSKIKMKRVKTMAVSSKIRAERMLVTLRPKIRMMTMLAEMSSELKLKKSVKWVTRIKKTSTRPFSN